MKEATNESIKNLSRLITTGILSRLTSISRAPIGVSVKKGPVGRDEGKGAVSARYLEHNRCKTVRYVAEVP